MRSGTIAPGYVAYMVGQEVTFRRSIVVIFRSTGNDCDDRDRAFALATGGVYGKRADREDWTLDAVRLATPARRGVYVGGGVRTI